MDMPTNLSLYIVGRFDLRAVYLVETMRLQVSYGNVKLAPPYYTSMLRSFTPKRMRCRWMNLGAKDFFLQEVLGESNGMDVKYYRNWGN